MNVENAVEFARVDNKDYTLKYLLISKEADVNDKNESKDTSFNEILYGIKIERIYNNIIEDYESTGWLSKNKNEVMHILNLLKKYSVGPLILPSVVDDLYSEFIET